ncbi:glycosyltransferase family 9 protein [bacterium]|nr:glycosyltransferase family 9 protein [bacterium]
MGIGNLILMSPMLQALRAAMPNARIIIQGSKAAHSSVILPEGLVDEHHIVDVAENSIWRFLKRGFVLRNQVDLLISDCHSLIFSLMSQVALMNIPNRIGHISSERWQGNYDFIYNLPVSMPAFSHEIDRYLRLLRPLEAYQAISPESANLLFSLQDKDVVHARNFMASLPNRKHVLGVQIGASVLWKQYPKALLVSVLSQLSAYPIMFVFLGSPADLALGEEIRDELNTVDSIVIHMTAELSQSAAVISGLDAVLTNDSGLMHVAHAFRKPLVALYGPTEYERTAPHGENVRLIRGECPCQPFEDIMNHQAVQNCPNDRVCLSSISSENVVQEVLASLEIAL